MGFIAGECDQVARFMEQLSQLPIANNMKTRHTVNSLSYLFVLLRLNVG